MPAHMKTSETVKGLQTTDAIIHFYSEWSETYDAELKEFSYVAHEKCAEILTKHINNKSASIIDIGCGTGLAGLALRAHDYQNIDGLDISAAMLSKAQDQGVYDSVYLLDIMETSTFPKQHYDALISAGLFARKHLRPNGIDNILMLLRSGGIACISICEKAYDQDCYQAKLDRLIETGVCSIIEQRQEDYIINHNVNCRIVVLQKK